MHPTYSTFMDGAMWPLLTVLQLSVHQCHPYLPLNIHFFSIVSSSHVSHHRNSSSLKNKPTHNTMNPITSFCLLFLLLTAPLCMAARPGSPKGKPPTNQSNKGGDDAGMGGFFGPGSGFGIPGLGNGIGNGIVGGGYGSGYGGPTGGNSYGGIIRPSVVCKQKGPCYMKKLTCPAKCFTSYSRSGKGYGGGGGGGGCTMDCKKKCIAYC